MGNFDRNVFHDITEIDKEFKTNSDRGLAVVVGSFIDQLLKELLQQFLTVDPKNDKEIFANNGPLSTFSAKIVLSYRLGLISHYEYKTINTIRSIRNDFAHDLGEVSFKNESIKQKCLNIRVPDNMYRPPIIPLPDIQGVVESFEVIRADTNDPRALFQETVIQIVLQLAGRTLDALVQKRHQVGAYKTAMEPSVRMLEILKQKRSEFNNAKERLRSLGSESDEHQDRIILSQIENSIKLLEYTLWIDELRED